MSVYNSTKKDANAPKLDATSRIALQQMKQQNSASESTYAKNLGFAYTSAGWTRHKMSVSSLQHNNTILNTPKNESQDSWVDTVVKLQEGCDYQEFTTSGFSVESANQDDSHDNHH